MQKELVTEARNPASADLDRLSTIDFVRLVIGLIAGGTATRMVLNMLTTGAMVKLGKTYGNLMVDLQATNSKLVQRSISIVHQLTELSESDARELLGYQHFFVWVLIATVPSFLVVSLGPLDREFGKRNSSHHTI